MASRVKRESEKRKKLAKRIARYFKRNYGIEEDLIDYYALVDTNLTFEENIKNIKRILNKAEKVRRAKDELLKQIYEFNEYWQEYGAKSYQIDKSKKAKKTFDPHKVTLRQLEAWLRNPNRYDLKGIDTPEKPKRKQKKKA
ncbi:MAG: hypothetical protein ACTSWZ_02110 [Candidatus Heimdallarchaeaceae archaeon]